MKRRLGCAVLAIIATLTLTCAPAEAAVNCRKVKCVALTFDDGPVPSTAKLLDLLRKKRTKVTFFLVGERAERRPALARRIAREGHEIGNHTYSHARLTELDDFEIFVELTSAQETIREVTGRRPAMMRPPYGATDQRVEAVAGQAGLPVMLWTGSTRDWELKNADAIVKKTLSLVRRDAVILMHDIQPQTVAAMPRILTALAKQGYRVVPLSAVLRGRLPAPGERFPAR